MPIQTILRLCCLSHSPVYIHQKQFLLVPETSQTTASVLPFGARQPFLRRSLCLPPSPTPSRRPIPLPGPCLRSAGIHSWTLDGKSSSPIQSLLRRQSI